MQNEHHSDRKDLAEIRRGVEYRRVQTLVRGSVFSFERQSAKQIQ
jgi:hypothetical protein